MSQFLRPPQSSPQQLTDMQPEVYQQGVPPTPTLLSLPTPQPPMNPSARKPPKRLWKSGQLVLFGLIVGLIIGGIIGYAAHTSPSRPITAVAQSPTVQPTAMLTLATSPTATPTEAPTPKPNPHGDVGVMQQSDLWSVTVNSVMTSTGDEFDTPKSGDIYVLINVTAENGYSSSQLIAENNFTLKDDQGNTYDTTIISDQHTFVGGQVVASQKLRGNLIYEMPKSLRSFTLQFDATNDSDGSQIVQWNLSD